MVFLEVLKIDEAFHSLHHKATNYVMWKRDSPTSISTAQQPRQPIIILSAEALWPITLVIEVKDVVPGRMRGVSLDLRGLACGYWYGVVMQTLYFISH